MRKTRTGLCIISWAGWPIAIFLQCVLVYTSQQSVGRFNDLRQQYDQMRAQYVEAAGDSIRALNAMVLTVKDARDRLNQPEVAQVLYGLSKYVKENPNNPDAARAFREAYEAAIEGAH